MSADEAFDNLMNRNAFSIPVAQSPGAQSAEQIETKENSAAAKPGKRQFSDGDRQIGEALRVSELFDDVPGDYRPRGGGPSADSERARVYAVPTETDLEPVSEEDGGPADISAAQEHGAAILGRDVNFDTNEFDGETGQYEHFADNEADGPAGLNHARRLRRFAYLPLSGMEGFEADAREIMARLVAVNPTRPSLAVTSAVRGEGKTELAIRLALAMAKKVDSRVLLIDFDLKNPKVAARLGVSINYFTLTDVLRGACGFGDALAVSDEDNLYVLPSRATDREGDETIDGRQVEKLLDELHRAFDFVIIDSGPVGNAGAIILTRLAGAAALAGRVGFSSASGMAEAGSRLEAAGARVAGMLLTGA